MVELPQWKILKAVVSSVNPSSERIEKLWRVVGLYESLEEPSHWWKLNEFVNKLMECRRGLH